MPFKTADEMKEYFPEDSNSNSDKPASNWNPWYRGESTDIRHESDGTGTLVGDGRASHASVDKDHLHYVNHEDGSRTVHHSDRTQGRDYYEEHKEETTTGLDGFFQAFTDFIGRK
jgi:hypothetical protein